MLVWAVVESVPADDDDSAYVARQVPASDYRFRYVTGLIADDDLGLVDARRGFYFAGFLLPGSDLDPPVGPKEARKRWRAAARREESRREAGAAGEGTA